MSLLGTLQTQALLDGKSKLKSKGTAELALI